MPEPAGGDAGHLGAQPELLLDLREDDRPRQVRPEGDLHADDRDDQQHEQYDQPADDPPAEMKAATPRGGGVRFRCRNPVSLLADADDRAGAGPVRRHHRPSMAPSRPAAVGIDPPRAWPARGIIVVGYRGDLFLGL